MKSSEQYALKKIDEWYSAKFADNYCEELEGEAIQSAALSIIEIMRTKELDLSAITEVRMVAMHLLARDYLVEHSKQAFSQSAKGMEMTLAQYESLRTAQDDEERRIYEKSAPLIAQLRQCEVFIQGVRARMSDIFPEELSFHTIDVQFLAAYGSATSYIDTALCMTDALQIFVEDEIVMKVQDADVPEALTFLRQKFLAGKIALQAIRTVIDRVFALPGASGTEEWIP